MSETSIGGHVKKAVQDLGIFNPTGYNKRYMVLSLKPANQVLQFYSEKPSPSADYQTPYNQLKLSELVRCRELDDGEI